FLSKAKKKSAWVQSALERFERPLLQYAQSILQDIDRARDTVQETFMRMHKQEQAAIEGHLSQWLSQITEKGVPLHLRGGQRVRSSSGRECLTASGDGASRDRRTADGARQ